ncbi:hypothetical protein NQZ68_029338, partial [Dissostichus eleginoides]
GYLPPSSSDALIDRTELLPGKQDATRHLWSSAQVELPPTLSSLGIAHYIEVLLLSLTDWALRNSTKSSSHRSSREEAADVAALLQQAQSTLEKLQSECEFLSSETQSSGVFSPGSLRVAACDLQMLMAAFSHVFETDLRAYCSRDPPSFSTETHVFQRIHQLLLAFIMLINWRNLPGE